MLSVQNKSPSLVGLFNIPDIEGCYSAKKLTQNLTKHDIKSCLKAIGCQISNLLFSAFTLSPRKGGEVACATPYIAVIPVSKQYRNRDIYVESGGDVLKYQDIKKQSIYSCIGQKADEKKGSISNSTPSKRLKWDWHYHLDNNADAKIITAAYCQQSKPCYISLAAAKSADGIETPKTLKATDDAPSVFFYVDAIAHPFITVQIRTESMVMLAGLSSDRPVSFVSGSLNPVSVTTPKDIETSGGDSLNTKEAAKWLLPLPQNRHLSGLSQQFAVILRQSKQQFTISQQLQNAKPVNRLSKTTFVSLPDALIKGALMRKVYESPCDLAEKADTILEVLNVIDGVIAQDCPNQKRTLTALNDLMRLAVHDLYCLLDGCEIRGGENA